MHNAEDNLGILIETEPHRQCCSETRTIHVRMSERLEKGGDHTGLKLLYTRDCDSTALALL